MPVSIARYTITFNTAIYLKKTAVAKLLLDSRPNVLDIGISDSPLHLAVQYNLPAIVSLLIDHGFSINILNKYGNTALYDTAAGKFKFAKLLIENSAGVDLGKECPCDAVCFNHIDMLKLLLKYGADPNRGNANHMPLSYGIQSNKKNIVKILLDHGANPNIATIMYEPLLYKLVRENRLDMVSLLL